MDSIDKKRIINRYNDRIERLGTTLEALASGTEERRQIRFRVLAEVGISSGDSVLDLGCGFGDFSEYLSRKNIIVSYTGYDINPTIINEARERYPGRKFEVKDILNEPFPEFDYIVSSSCFNLPLTNGDNYDFIAKILLQCYQHVRKGVSIDFLTSYVDYESPEGFHYEPERVFALAKKITKRVCLRHDYPLFEFNLYLYKDFKGWGKNASMSNI